MEKKIFFRGVGTTSNKSNQESVSKSDYARKRNSQTTRKKDLDKNEKAPPNRGRGVPRNARSREKVQGQLNSQNCGAGSIYKSGSKNQRNITHQLVYPDYHPNSSNRQHHHFKSNWRRSNFCGDFSKEQYLQANCQFVVSAGNDYSLYEKDPDKLVEWNFVEEVWVHCADSPNCPICLYPPVAAKISKCGHIFCYSCMLHYLALSDNKWRNCPICTVNIDKKSLKSVIAIKRKEYNIGEEIEMILMRRNRDSLIPTPVNSSMISTTHPYSDFNHLKLIKFSSEEVIKYIISREQHELEFQKNIEEDQPEVCFIDEALNLLEARKQKLSECNIIGDQLESLNLCEQAMALQPVSVAECIPADDNNQESRNGAKPTYYFYQAITGSHVYLHSLNVQMLTKEFGSFENCPHSIKGIVIEKDTISMTSDFRQRFRYLKHLPLSCLFDLMELRITAPLVSPTIVYEFKKQIETRANKRKEKEKELKKIEQRVQIEEDEMFGRNKKWNDVGLDSRTQFPDFSAEPSIVSEEVIGQEATAKAPSQIGKSFAQMIKKNKKTVSPEMQWPSLSDVALPDLSQNDEESYKVPAYNAAFLKATGECTPIVVPSCKAEKGQRKKKSKKKKLLFSTGGQKL